LVLVALAFVTTVRGIRDYRRIQRFVIAPLVVGSNIILIVLLTGSHDLFISNFNAWHEQALGQSNFAAKVEAAAANGGFQDPGFSLKNTVLFLSVTGLIWYVVFAAQGLLGEAKQANNFKKLFVTFIVGGLYVGLVAWVIPTWLFERMVGREFINVYAFAFNTGEISAPAGATVTSFAMMMTSNPIVLILLSLGFIAVGYYFATCVFLNMTRVLSAMGMDRTIPEWFSKVSERFHSPVNAALFYLLLSLGLNILYRVNEAVQITMIYGGAFTSVGVIAVTGLAGLFFAYQAKNIHDASPVGNYRVFGLPLITVVGVISLLGAGSVTVMNLVFPELGFTTFAARALLLVSLIASAIWFFAYRAYLKRWRGVNPDLAFKQVPPE
jgi:amino acid transporter